LVYYMTFYDSMFTYNITSILFFLFSASTEIYTLSLHDALPILREIVYNEGLDRCENSIQSIRDFVQNNYFEEITGVETYITTCRSEEHTSELQSRENLVCRLLLEKKKY